MFSFVTGVVFISVLLPVGFLLEGVVVTVVVVLFWSLFFGTCFIFVIVLLSAESFSLQTRRSLPHSKHTPHLCRPMAWKKGVTVRT